MGHRVLLNTYTVFKMQLEGCTVYSCTASTAARVSIGHNGLVLPASHQTGYPHGNRHYIHIITITQNCTIRSCPSTWQLHCPFLLILYVAHYIIHFLLPCHFTYCPYPKIHNQFPCFLHSYIILDLFPQLYNPLPFSIVTQSITCFHSHTIHYPFPQLHNPLSIVTLIVSIVALSL